jgi:mannitol/fructose-specific phosphotransferase system IIA component (Ntr-type)
MNFGDTEIPVIELPAAATTEPEAAIRFLVERLADTGAFTRADVPAVVTGVLRREMLGSTSVGRGIAVPSYRGEPVRAVGGIVGTTTTGVPWPNAEGVSARIHRVCLMVTPAGTDGITSLRALEEIVRRLRGDRV